MNFIDAIGSKSGEKIKVENRILGKFELPQNQVSGNHINNKLSLGIRPELISINPRKSKSADFIEGEIEEISYLGETCLLYTSPSPRDAHESRMPSSA